MYRFCNYSSVLSGRSRILEPGPRQSRVTASPQITTFNQQGADNDE
eukprot:UN08543